MSFGPSVRGGVNSYVDFSVAPFSGYVSSPLSGALNCGNQNLNNVGVLSADEVLAEQVGLPAGSLQTSVEFNDPVRCSLSRSGIATIAAAASEIVVPLAGVGPASVILCQYIIPSGGAVDATLTAISHVELGAGNFKIVGNLAATADVKVSWLVAKL